MSGEASTAVQPSTVLTEDRIYICPKQFDEKSKELLTTSAKGLGATITNSAKDATIFLTNPSALSYETDMAALATDHPVKGSTPTQILPYHWVANCRINDARLPLTALPSPTPLFTHPDPNKSHFPVKIWVSINVIKRSHETPYTAQQNVSDTVEQHGALLVTKRSQADVLIVDRSTRFYQTIKDEIAQKSRKDQIVAERDWVDDCVHRKRLSWKLEDTKATQSKSNEAEKDSDDDSFKAEDPVPKGKGPGRPTGVPRVDYSAEDDDFMCRYLAHLPSNSFSSRKTYQLMVADEEVAEAARYPIAGRHSAQSWHERFRKNVVNLTKRVMRLRAAGIDESLKTAEERAKAAAAPEEIERRAAVSATDPEPESSPTAAREIRKPSGSASKSRLDARSAPAKPTAASASQPIQEPPSRSNNLVEPDGESDPSQQVGPSQSFAPTEPMVEVEPIPPVDIVMEETVVIETVAAEGPAGVQDQSFDDRMAIDEVLADSRLQQSASTQQSNGHESNGGLEETQALLSDFARARAAAAARAANATPSPEATSRRRRHREQDVTRSPRREAPYSPGRSALRSPNRPPTALRPAEGLTIGSPGRSAAGPRTSMPAVVHVEVQAIEVGGNIIDVQQQGTPRRKSLLQRELETSSARRAAQAPRPSRERSPDRVYASTRLPPARSSPHIPSSSSPAPGSERRRNRTPPLSNAEKMRRISQGAEIAEAQKNAYRDNMLRLATKYGTTPKELSRVMNSLRLRGIGGGWARVEEEVARLRAEVDSEFGDGV